MYTKSIIQQTVEALRVKENYRAAIENLMERYNIEDSVFVLKNGFLHEAVSGYFAVENIYDSLEKAQEAGALVWNYGALLNALLNFFIISFILFLVVKYLGKINRKNVVEEVEVKKATTKNCPYCISEIPIEAVKCAHCTSDIKGDK